MFELFLFINIDCIVISDVFSVGEKVIIISISTSSDSFVSRVSNATASGFVIICQLVHNIAAVLQLVDTLVMFPIVIQVVQFTCC